jgi:hypothetical protein
MTERRLWLRWTVAWSVRLFVADQTAMPAQATDASRQGLHLTIDGPAPLLAAGQKCRVEVVLPGHAAHFRRDAEVRHVGTHGIGLAITDPLPAALVPASASAPLRDSPAKSKPGRLRSVVRRLSRRSR